MPSGYIIYEEGGALVRHSNSFWGGAEKESESQTLEQLLVEIGAWGPESPRGFYKEGRFQLNFAESDLMQVEVSGLGLGHFIADVEWGLPGKNETDEILATIGHELRSPLNGIIGFTGLLESSDLVEEQREIVEKLQFSNWRLNGLLCDSLEFAQLRLGQISLEPVTFELGAFVEELDRLFATRMERAGLKYASSIDGEKGKSLSLPRSKLTQAVEKLISTAIQSAVGGEVLLRAAYQRDRRGLAKVSFEVEYSGVSLGELHETFINDPFGNSLAVRDRVPRGISWGLAVSGRLATLMGGGLEYGPSEKRGGYIFKLSVPIPVEGKVSPSKKRKKTPPRVEILRKEFASKKVLIVEDNRLNSDILSHFLADLGLENEVVVDGQEAIDAYEDGKYDIILMDVMLPKVDGFEATAGILAKRGEGIEIPIVGVTAKVFREDRQKCFDAGMVEVVHKPVDFNLMRATLEQYLLGNEIMEALAASPDQAEPMEEEKSSGVLGRSVLKEYLQRMSSKYGDEKEVLENYFGAIEMLMKDLKEATERADIEATERNAHSLKGNLGLIGAWNMQVLARGMELAATRNVEFRAEHWFGLLESALWELKSKVREELPECLDMR